MTPFEDACAELEAFVLEIAPPHRATKFAPSTWEALQNWAKFYDGCDEPIPVSSEHCENTIYSSPEGNHAFRAWHDTSHLKFNLAFTYVDEIRLAKIHQEIASELSYAARCVLWIDTAMQSVYEHNTGDFPNNQREFVKHLYYAGVCPDATL